MLAFARSMEKSRLRTAILERIAADLDVQTRAAMTSHDEATHEESKPENQYDMHAQEAAYLAEGQARLVAELRDTLTAFQSLSIPAFAASQALALGALVTLEAANRRTQYFLGPRSGGLEVELDGNTIVVVTPQSPLGRNLLGRRLGDTVQLPGRGGSIAHRIVAVE